jgi:predicted RNA-binding protein associated with RNAse of E/G family
MRPRGQTLLADGGHQYDVLDVVDRDGNGQKLYFQIDRVTAAEAALLASKHR